MRSVGLSLRQGGAVIDQASRCKPGQDLGAAKSDVPVRQTGLPRTTGTGSCHCSRAWLEKLRTHTLRREAVE